MHDRTADTDGLVVKPGRMAFVRGYRSLFRSSLRRFARDVRINNQTFRISMTPLQCNHHFMRPTTQSQSMTFGPLHLYSHSPPFRHSPSPPPPPRRLLRPVLLQTARIRRPGPHQRLRTRLLPMRRLHQQPRLIPLGNVPQRVRHRRDAHRKQRQVDRRGPDDRDRRRADGERQGRRHALGRAQDPDVPDVVLGLGR